MIIARIVNWLNTVIHINRYKQEYETRLITLADMINDVKQFQFERNFNELLLDSEKLKQLNLQLSTSPTIWGDESRLEISSKASVISCVFNTNSGTIKIGDYTYAGSGVSILAGSHDFELQGFLRRDVEYKEGFDIEIGKGVWLASNVTVLGPCIIEDDAVIASGSVVVPGTHVHVGELYAGVPAKKVQDLKVLTNLENNSKKLQEVINRESGVLFYSGWSEKKVVSRKGMSYLGHWTDSTNSIIYSDRKKLQLVFVSDDNDTSAVSIYIENERIKNLQVVSEPSVIELATGIEELFVKISIKTENRVFVARKDSDIR